MTRPRRVLRRVLNAADRVRFDTRSTTQHGEKAAETADLYFEYGKALLENAIAQSGVLGKRDNDDALDDNGASASQLWFCPHECQMPATLSSPRWLGSRWLMGCRSTTPG